MERSSTACRLFWKGLRAAGSPENCVFLIGYTIIIKLKRSSLEDRCVKNFSGQSVNPHKSLNPLMLLALKSNRPLQFLNIIILTKVCTTV